MLVTRWISSCRLSSTVPSGSSSEFCLETSDNGGESNNPAQPTQTNTEMENDKRKSLSLLKTAAFLSCGANYIEEQGDTVKFMVVCRLLKRQTFLKRATFSGAKALEKGILERSIQNRKLCLRGRSASAHLLPLTQSPQPLSKWISRFRGPMLQFPTLEPDLSIRAVWVIC